MSTATAAIRRRFSVSRLPSKPRPHPVHPPRPGEILLLTGPSGSGKSTLLQAIAGRIPNASRLDLARLPLPERPAVDLFPDLPLEDRLWLLSRVGLAEVYSWLRTPQQLSDGQRRRLRLALALARSRNLSTTLICDEYASTLDTLTALIVSTTLRKLITSTPNLSALFATGRHELIPALAPDRLIHCDFEAFHETPPRGDQT